MGDFKSKSNYFYLLALPKWGGLGGVKNVETPKLGVSTLYCVVITTVSDPAEAFLPSSVLQSSQELHSLFQEYKNIPI
jgi:hypothetical protein